MAVKSHQYYLAGRDPVANCKDCRGKCEAVCEDCVDVLRSSLDYVIFMAVGLKEAPSYFQRKMRVIYQRYGVDHPGAYDGVSQWEMDDGTHKLVVTVKNIFADPPKPVTLHLDPKTFASIAGDRFDREIEP